MVFFDNEQVNGCLDSSNPDRCLMALLVQNIGELVEVNKERNDILSEINVNLEQLRYTVRRLCKEEEVY